jgi:hypothetical protein
LAARNWLKTLGRCIEGAAEGAAGKGFSLAESGDDTCRLLAIYGQSLSAHGFEYGWIKKELLGSLRGQAGDQAEAKFLSALKKGMAERSQGATGIKLLDLSRPHPNLPKVYTATRQDREIDGERPGADGTGLRSLRAFGASLRGQSKSIMAKGLEKRQRFSEVPRLPAKRMGREMLHDF